MGKFDQLTLQQVFDDFLEEIVEELTKYGKLEDVQVMENLGDHMIGSVYAKYEDEEDAEKCLEAMNGRYYAGRKLEAEYSSVTDFREARCRSYDESICDRGPFCNFMHVRGLVKRCVSIWRKIQFLWLSCDRQSHDGKHARLKCANPRQS